MTGCEGLIGVWKEYVWHGECSRNIRKRNSPQLLWTKTINIDKWFMDTQAEAEVDVEGEEFAYILCSYIHNNIICVIPCFSAAWMIPRIFLIQDCFFSVSLFSLIDSTFLWMMSVTHFYWLYNLEYGSNKNT